MIIKYLNVQMKYAIRGKAEQAAKLSEWANVEIEKKRGLVNENQTIG